MRELVDDRPGSAATPDPEPRVLDDRLFRFGTNGRGAATTARDILGAGATTGLEGGRRGRAGPDLGGSGRVGVRAGRAGLRLGRRCAAPRGCGSWRPTSRRTTGRSPTGTPGHGGAAVPDGAGRVDRVGGRGGGDRRGAGRRCRRARGPAGGAGRPAPDGGGAARPFGSLGPAGSGTPRPRRCGERVLGSVGLGCVLRARCPSPWCGRWRTPALRPDDPDVVLGPRLGTAATRPSAATVGHSRPAGASPSCASWATPQGAPGSTGPSASRRRPPPRPPAWVGPRADAVARRGEAVLLDAGPAAGRRPGQPGPRLARCRDAVWHEHDVAIPVVGWHLAGTAVPV